MTKPNKTHTKIVRLDTHLIHRPIRTIRIPQRLTRDLLLLTSPRLKERGVESRELGVVQPGGVPWGIHREEDVGFVLDEGVVPAAVGEVKNDVVGFAYRVRRWWEWW